MWLPALSKIERSFACMDRGMNLLLNLSPSRRKSHLDGNVACIGETGGPYYSFMLTCFEIRRTLAAFLRKDPILDRRMEPDVVAPSQIVDAVRYDAIDIREYVTLARRNARNHAIAARAHAIVNRFKATVQIVFPIVR